MQINRLFKETGIQTLLLLLEIRHIPIEMEIAGYAALLAFPVEHLEKQYISPLLKR